MTYCTINSYIIKVTRIFKARDHSELTWHNIVQKILMRYLSKIII